MPQNETLLEEQEMDQKLLDMESSFLPEHSTIQVPSVGQDRGLDDSLVPGVLLERGQGGEESMAPSDVDVKALNKGRDVDDSSNMSRVSGENRQGHQFASQQSEDESSLGRSIPGTSMDDSVYSTTAAAARDMQRTNPSSEPSAERPVCQQSLDSNSRTQGSVADTRPPTSQTVRQDTSREQSLQSLFPGGPRAGSDRSSATSNDKGGNHPFTRSSTRQLSSSSMASSNAEATNSGADYALQTGGAAPSSTSQNKIWNNDLARSVSVGSMASGVSGLGDESSLDKTTSGRASLDDGAATGLETLDEEHTHSTQENDPEAINNTEPVTPKGPERHDNLGTSPRKLTGALSPGFTRSGRSMTLKEQSSTIDRLSKENFGLKIKIHFLNVALDERSEEGIKDVVSENVELKSDKLNLQKQIQMLKRQVRDMERRFRDKELFDGANHEASEDGNHGSAQQEEILFLRKRLGSYEVEIEKLRNDSFAKESEKTRLAAAIRALNEGRTTMASGFGAREERVSYTYVCLQRSGLANGEHHRICGRTC